ncbi:MAG: hypothetical protein U1E35_00980 [Rhodospirillales bacterium]
MRIERNTAVEAEQVERAFQLHLRFRLGVAELLDADKDAADMGGEWVRQARQRRAGDAVDVIQSRRYGAGGGRSRAARDEGRGAERAHGNP